MPTPTESPSRAAPDGKASAERLRGTIRDAIGATAARHLPFRARAGLALVVVVASTAFVVAVASAVVYARPAVGLDVAPGAQVHLLIVLCLLGLLVTWATWVPLTRGATGFGVPVTALAAATLAVVPGYALLVLVLPVHAADPPALAAGVSPWGARCLVVAAAVGAAVLAALSAALRHAVPVAGSWRGGAVGAAAGLWSGIAVFFFCPAHELNHLLIGHVAPIAVFVLAGLIAVPRVLRI